MVRTVPGEGLIVYPANDKNVAEVLAKGAWTPCESFATLDHKEIPSNLKAWHIINPSSDFDEFDICFKERNFGRIKWSLMGLHNVQNALAALAAAHHVGVEPKLAIEALSLFKGVKRRMEVKGVVNGITVFDDFAHHPTAIQTTLEGLRAKVGSANRIIAVLDIRSNTMKAGHHQEALANSLFSADEVYLYQSPEIKWDVNTLQKNTQKPGMAVGGFEELLELLTKTVKPTDSVLFMSNGGFGGIQLRFLERLSS